MSIEDGVIVVGYDSTQVAAGVAKDKKSLADLSQSAQKSGEQGARGIEQMGTAANNVADVVDKAARRQATTLQRLIAQQRAGAKNTADYFTELKKVEGNFDNSALIAQLRAAEKQTLRNAAANNVLTNSNKGTELSAKQLGFALRNVPAQMSDIVVSLQAGQKPLTVLLQQGTQLKDLFGGVGNATRALGGYLIGLISPLSLALTAGAGLVAAYAAGSAESDRLANSLIKTGNIAASSSGNLTNLATTVGKTAGEYRNAREAIEALVSTGVIGGDLLETALRGTVAITKLTGATAQDAAKDFEKLATDPLKGLVDLNKTQNFLTLEIYKQITALEKQGKTQEAVKLAFETYEKVVSSRSVDVAKNLGIIEQGWLAIKKATAGAIDSALDVGRIKSNTDKLREATAELQRLYSQKNYATGATTGTEAEIAAQIAVVKKINAAVFKENEKSRLEGEKALAQKTAIIQQDVYEKYIGSNNRLSKSGVLAKELAEENTAFAAATKGFERTSAEYQSAYKTHQQAIANIKDKSANKDVENELKRTATAYGNLKEKTLDFIRTQQQELAQSAPVNAAQKLAAELIDFIADKKGKLFGLNTQLLMQMSEELVANDRLIEAQKEQAKLDKEFEKIVEQQLADNQKYIASIYDRIVATEAEVENFDKLPSQIEATTIARLEEVKAIALANGLADANVANIQREIDARKQLKPLLEAKETKEANKKASDEAEKEAERTTKEIQKKYERMAESINDSLTDALLRGFESGKDFAENFKDTLINMFKTLVLKPVIQGVLAPVTGGLTNLLGGGAGGIGGGIGGVAGIADVGGGGATSIFKQLGSIGDIFSKGNSAIVSGIESLGASIANGAGGFRDTIGGFLGQNAGGISNALPYAGALLQAFSGDIKGAAFTAIGTAIGGPIGGAIGGIVGSLLGGKSYKRYGTSVSGMYDGNKYSDTGRGIVYDRDIGAGDSLSALNKQFSENFAFFLKGFDLNSVFNVSSSQYQRGKSKKSGGNFSANVGGEAFSLSVVGKKLSGQQVFDMLLNKVLGEGLVKGIQASGAPEGIKRLFDGLLDKTQVANMINASVTLNDAQAELATRFGLTVDAAGLVSVASGAAGDELVKFATNLATAATATRTIGQSLVKSRESLLTEFNEVFGDVVTEAVLSTVNKQVPIPAARPTNGYFGMSGAFTGDNFGLGGIASLMPQIQQFKTVSEQVTTYISTIISKNLALPKTLKDYDALLSGIDKTTAGGQKMFADVFALRDQFIAIVSSVDSIKGGVKGSLFNLVSEAEQQKILNEDLAKAFADVNLAVPGSVSELIGIGKSLTDELNTGTASASALTLAAAFPSLVQAFESTRKAANDLFDDLTAKNSFATLAEFRSFKGAANNFGQQFAMDYVANTRAGNLSVNGQGKTVQTSDGNAEVVQLLKDLRDLSKQTITGNQDVAGNLERLAVVLRGQ